MHAFSHEYQMVNVRRGKDVVREPKYVGSRCHNPECPESRHPATLPLLAASPNVMLFPKRSRVVTPQKRKQ